MMRKPPNMEPPLYDMEDVEMAYEGERRRREGRLNTVRRYSDPNNPWWRYAITLGETNTQLRFANAQAAEDWIEKYGRADQIFHWDTRDPNEQRDIDRYEEAKHDAEVDARLEAEEE